MSEKSFPALAPVYRDVEFILSSVVQHTIRDRLHHWYRVGLIFILQSRADSCQYTTHYVVHYLSPSFGIRTIVRE